MTETTTSTAAVWAQAAEAFVSDQPRFRGDVNITEDGVRMSRRAAFHFFSFLARQGTVPRSRAELARDVLRAGATDWRALAAPPAPGVAKPAPVPTARTCAPAVAAEPLPLAEPPRRDRTRRRPVETEGVSTPAVGTEWRLCRGPCQRLLPLTEFSRLQRGPQGRNRYCRRCEAARVKRHAKRRAACRRGEDGAGQATPAPARSA